MSWLTEIMGNTILMHFLIEKQRKVDEVNNCLRTLSDVSEGFWNGVAQARVESRAENTQTVI